MALPRRIVVDDTDPAIQYSADAWFPHDVNQLQIGNLGPVWNGTTQSTSVDGATLSFTFNGTSISLLGSIELQVDEDTGVVDPTWTCLVDEIAIGGADPTFKFPENNWLLCNQPTLLDGQHTLTVKVQTKGQPFYADSIVYTPMPDVSLDGAVLEYDSGDSAITYGKGWEFYDHGAVQNITQTKGAQVALSFHGTAVTLTGYVPAELPHNATSCKYSLDGGPETTFTLHGLPVDTNTSAFNVPILTVSALTPATHNLSITYEGDVTKTPLGVQAFYVTNAVAGGAGRGAASSSSSASGTPTITTGSTDASGTAGSDTTSTTHTKHSSTGAIAGGVIGGVLLLAALAALLFWCLRRRRQPPNHADDITAMTVESGPASFAGYQSNAVPSASGYTSSSSNGYPYTHLDTTMPASSGSASGSADASTSSGSASGGIPAPTATTKAQELGDVPRRVIVQRHEDSGVRLDDSELEAPGHGSALEIVDLPPNYSRD